MTDKFILISFCNNPSFSTNPILCAKIPHNWMEAITYAPVSLGFPDPIAQVTGLAKNADRGFVLFTPKTGIQYLAVLKQSGLTPLFYQELPGLLDCHSMLAVKNHLYVVSTGTDEVLRYDIFDDSVRNPVVVWQASSSKKDTHHVNSICEKDGDIFVSAFGTKTGQFWSTADNGYIHNITENVRVKEGIYHPHSLSVIDDRMYYSNSQNNTFCSLDNENTLFDLNGYTRGVVWLSGDFVGVASSIGRKVSKSTGLIANPGDPGDPAGECSLIIGNIASKKIVRKEDLSWFGPEIYDLLRLDDTIDLLETSVSAHLSERKLVKKLTSKVHAITDQTAEKDAVIAEKDAVIAEKDAVIAEKDAVIAEIVNSRAWKFVLFLRAIRLKIFPTRT